MISALSPLSPAESAREAFPAAQKSSPDGVDFFSMLLNQATQAQGIQVPSSPEPVEASRHFDAADEAPGDAFAEAELREGHEGASLSEKTAENRDRELRDTSCENGTKTGSDRDSKIPLLLQKALQADGRMVVARVERTAVPGLENEISSAQAKPKNGVVSSPVTVDAAMLPQPGRMNPESRVSGREKLSSGDLTAQKPSGSGDSLKSLQARQQRQVETASVAIQNAPFKSVKPEGLAKKDEAGKATEKEEAGSPKKKERAKAHFDILPTQTQTPAETVHPTKTAEAQAVGEKAQGKLDSSKNEKSDVFAPALKHAATQHVKGGEASSMRLPHPIDFMQSVSAQVRLAVVEGRETLTVKLQPENLGKMTITLGREESGLLTGKLTVETEAVKQLLDSSMSDLKDHLENAGIRFQDLSVDVKSEPGRRGNGGENAGEGPVFTQSKSILDKAESAFARLDLFYSDRLVNLLA